MSSENARGAPAGALLVEDLGAELLPRPGEGPRALDELDRLPARQLGHLRPGHALAVIERGRLLQEALQLAVALLQEAAVVAARPLELAEDQVDVADHVLVVRALVSLSGVEELGDEVEPGGGAHPRVHGSLQERGPPAPAEALDLAAQLVAPVPAGEALVDDAAFASRPILVGDHRLFSYVRR